MPLSKKKYQWVLIRGIASEEFHWSDFLSLLKERFTGHTVHTADIIGNGRHFNKTTPLGIRANVEGLREQVLGDGKGEGKKVLFGFSLGGMLALEWAHIHPDEVSAVVLVNSSLSNAPLYKRFRPTALAKVVKAFRQSDFIQREMEIIGMTSRRLSESRIREIAHAWGPRGQLYPSSVSNFLLQLALAARIRQRESPPPAPVLILSSRNDGVVHPKCSRLIAANWNHPTVSHRIHDEAGHDLTLDDPHWVLDQLENWLKKSSDR